MPDAFKFELVSPERLLVSGEVEQVLVPGAEGDMTVLAHHAPLLTTLRPGLLEIGLPGGGQQRFFIRGGFAEVGPSGLTVLAETAIDLVELDADRLAQAVKDAEEDVTDAAEGAVRDRAQTKLALAEERASAGAECSLRRAAKLTGGTNPFMTLERDERVRRQMPSDAVDRTGVEPVGAKPDLKRGHARTGREP